MIATATNDESWSFSPGAPAQATPSATAYVTPDVVLPAPGDPDLHVFMLKVSKAACGLRTYRLQGPMTWIPPPARSTRM
jgi:hypothetical protein